MKVQDKIDELVGKFSQHVNPYIGSGMLSNTHDDDAILWQAKKCALITVNEILANTPMYTGNLNTKWKFWNDVKLELEKQLNLNGSKAQSISKEEQKKLIVDMMKSDEEFGLYSGAEYCGHEKTKVFKRPKKEDYDFNDNIEGVRYAKDMNDYADKLEEQLRLYIVGSSFIHELIQKETDVRTKLAENLDLYKERNSMQMYERTFDLWNKQNLVLWDLKDILCRMGQDVD